MVIHPHQLVLTLDKADLMQTIQVMRVIIRVLETASCKALFFFDSYSHFHLLLSGSHTTTWEKLWRHHYMDFSSCCLLG